MRFVVSAFLALAAIEQASAAGLPTDQLEFFENRIRPVFVEKCYQCHSAGAEKLKGGLYLDHRAGLLEGGDSGPAIVTGDPDASLLIESIRYHDPDLEMPPKEKLSDDVIRDFETWIAAGAPDPRDEAVKVKLRRVLYEAADADAHWAFQPILSPTPPALDDPWIRNPIDAFILAALREATLEPSPPATPAILLRRVAYTLTGLPWTGDATPCDAAVDELLASEQYGVHWGRHWLDVARYADNNGNRLAQSGANPYYPHAWTYRDWVVDAFNSDLPYDEFVRHQIAGDAFATGDHRTPHAALGFLRVGRSFGQNVDDRIDDRIDALCKGFLGLTVSCARCHDHKFDPILTKDYYALHGIFMSSEDIDLDLVDRENIPGHEAFSRERETRMIAVRDEARNGINALISGYLHRSDELLLAAQKFLDGETREKVAAVAAREFEIEADIFQAWVAALEKWKDESNPVFTPWFNLQDFNPAEFAKIESGEWKTHPIVAKNLLVARPRTRAELAAFYRDLAIEVETAAAGQYPITELIVGWENQQRRWIPEEYDRFADSPAPLEDPAMEELRRVFLGFEGPWGGPRLPPQLLNRSGAAPYRTQVKMAALEGIKHEGEDSRAPVMAMAMRDHAKPANSPVYIRGDAKNPGEEAPRAFLARLSAPDAAPYANGSGRLDLAHDIANAGNPLTARVIVNRIWQWHFGSGLVATESDFGLQGTPPSHPELLDWLATWFIDNGWSIKNLHRLILASNTWQQSSHPRTDAMEIDPSNRLLWRMSPRQLQFEEARDSILLASGELDLTVGGRPTPQGQTSHRRTAFLYVDRYELPYEFANFDFANPDFSTARRESSIVPPQALYYLNDPWIADRAAIAARKASAAEGGDPAKLQTLWHTIYRRPPSDAELALAHQLLAENGRNFAQVAHAMLSSNEFTFVR